MTRFVYTGHVEFPAWGIGLRNGDHEPIISLDTYHKVQARRNGTAKLPKRADINRDFVLRGAVSCGDCNVPLKSGWSKGKNKKYPYYLCQTKGCASYGKSIRRGKIEGEFETFLKALTPSAGLFAIVRTMFKDAWDQIAAHGSSARETLEHQLRPAERQADKLLDLIVGTDSPRLVSSYEARLNALESEKCLLREKLGNTGQPTRPFDELLEHSLTFLSNPWKLWDKGSFEVRRTILKLVLIEPLSYRRETGTRTPEIALPFKALGGFHIDKCEMVRPRRLELPRVLPHSDLNAARLPIPPRPHT